MTDSRPSSTYVFSKEHGILKIHFEHELINHRMMWLITTEAFLVTAYFLISTSNYHNIKPTIIIQIKYLIIMVGSLISISAIISIFAAIIAINVWRNRVPTEDQIGTVSALPIHFFGEFLSVLIPATLIGFWFIIYSTNIDEFSKSHLSDVIYVFYIAGGAAGGLSLIVISLFYTIARRRTPKD